VLSLPPAFALSQDQTLKLDENLFRLITTFDEVPPSPRYDRYGAAYAAPHLPHRGIGVDLKRVPPKSRPTASAPGSIQKIFRSQDQPLAGSGPQGLRRPRFSFF
jgi:hypothetical protein